MYRDNLDLLNESKLPAYYRFPLANLQKGPMIDFVPISNPANILILLCICFGNLEPSLIVKSKKPYSSLNISIGLRLTKSTTIKAKRTRLPEYSNDRLSGNE